MSLEPRVATAAKGGVVLAVKVQPRAGVARVHALREHTLCVKVKSPPDKGRANSEVIAVLADFFGVKKAALEITAGAASRKKRVLIRGVPLEDVEKRIAGLSG